MNRKVRPLQLNIFDQEWRDVWTNRIITTGQESLNQIFLWDFDEDGQGRVEYVGDQDPWILAVEDLQQRQKEQLFAVLAEAADTREERKKEFSSWELKEESLEARRAREIEEDKEDVAWIYKSRGNFQKQW